MIKERLARLSLSALTHNKHIRAVAFTTVLAFSEITSPTPVNAEPLKQPEIPALPIKLDDWQKGALRFGLAAFLAGAYASSIGSTLRQNEGSSKKQKRFNNIGLAAKGLGVAAIESFVITTPL